MLITDKDGNAGWEDKLCWAEEGLQTFVPDTAFIQASDDGSWVMPGKPNAIPPDGAVCTLILNGVEHTCKAVQTDMEGIPVVMVGNSAVLGGVDTGETFCMVFIADEATAESMGYHCMGADLTGSATSFVVKLTAMVETVKKIDEKYVPGYICGNFPFENREFLPALTFDTTSGSAKVPAFAYPIVVGNNYTVTYNGTAYEMQAVESYGNVVLGSEDDPIEITYFPNGYWDSDTLIYGGIRVKDGATSAKVSIIGSGVEVRKIPGNYVQDAPLVVTVAVKGEGLGEIELVSHSYDMIRSAYKDGRPIFCRLVTSFDNTRDYFFPLTEYSSYDNSFNFENVLWSGSNLGSHVHIKIAQDGNAVKWGTPTLQDMKIDADGGLVLRSFSGKEFKITVSDDGTLTATAL